MKYLWMKNNGELKLLEDPTSLITNPEYDDTRDRIFQIGSEMRLSVQLEPVKKAGFRSDTYQAGTR